MKNVPTILVLIGTSVIVSLAFIVGCGDPPDMRDQRLVDVAREAMSEQRKQNDRIADQSLAVIDESRQLADTARGLVETHQSLNSQIGDQRANVDAGRDQLEQERRDIASQRLRDSLLVTVLQQAVLLAVCLLPLFICLQIVRRMQSDEPDHAAVTELLVHELTSQYPRLRMEPFQPAAIPYQPSGETDGDETSDATAGPNPR